MKRKSKLYGYYPMFMDLKGRKCVVIGGGKVALRKVTTIIKYGANVEIISPELCFELQETVNKAAINFHKRSYKHGDLRDAFMVFVTTANKETNRKIITDARKEGVLVNAATEPEEGDFIVPSCLYRGDITVAVSTQARSPALARKIRMELERYLGQEYAVMAELVESVRIELKNQKIRVDTDAWEETLDIDWLRNLINHGDNDEAKTILLENLKKRRR